MFRYFQRLPQLPKLLVSSKVVMMRYFQRLPRLPQLPKLLVSTIPQNEQALRQLRASSINGEKLQCAIYYIPESMISEVTLVTNITRYSHIFFKTSICGTYRAPTGSMTKMPRPRLNHPSLGRSMTNMHLVNDKYVGY